MLITDPKVYKLRYLTYTFNGEEIAIDLVDHQVATTSIGTQV